MAPTLDHLLPLTPPSRRNFPSEKPQKRTYEEGDF